MRKAARYFIGTHDFSSFQASGSDVGISPVREVSRVEVDCFSEGNMRVSVEATGFLRHMVRILVGTLAEVGGGRIQVLRIPEILHARDRRQAGRTAPAKGLFLKWVQYPEGMRAEKRGETLSQESEQSEERLRQGRVLFGVNEDGGDLFKRRHSNRVFDNST